MSAPAPTQTKVKLTLAMFDDPGFMGTGVKTPDKFRIIGDAIDIADFAPLTGASYNPRGSTPLRDATMRMLTALDETKEADSVTVGLLVDESGSMQPNRESVIASVNEFIVGLTSVDAVDQEAAGKVLCVVVTDGYENASTEVSPKALAAAVKQREDEGWTFIYLGANQDAWDTGTKSVGLSGSRTGQTRGFTSTPQGVDSAMKSVTADAVSYLGDQGEYAAAAAAAPNKIVAEDGEETIVTGSGQVTPDIPGGLSDSTPPPQPTSPDPSVKNALDQARRSISK